MVILAGDTIAHINGPDFYWFEDIQLGIDGKVYVSWRYNNMSGVSVVSKPNEPGSLCEFQPDLLHWETLSIRLPAFAASFFRGDPTIRSDFECIPPFVNF